MKPKLPNKRILCLAVTEMLSSVEPSPNHEGCQLVDAANPEVAADFPEGREDPGQSAELELQQDA